MLFSSRTLDEPPRKRRRTGRNAAAVILACVLLSILCAACNKQSEPAVRPLTQDERYLIDAYVNVIRARDLRGRDPSGAESIFAVIDSTTDTLRMANTIKDINRNPDRWLYIFETIDAELQASSKQNTE